MTILTKTDLPTAIQSAELIDVMVAGANARAARVAPCLAPDANPAPTADQLAEAKLILVGAVKRWAEAGAGSVQSQAAGPFSVTVDTRQRGGFNLWPTEITDLQAICKTGAGKAFTIDTAPCVGGVHSPICSLMFGGATCSCGADLAGVPLYEDVEP